MKRISKLITLTVFFLTVPVFGQPAIPAGTYSVGGGVNYSSSTTIGSSTGSGLEVFPRIDYAIVDNFSVGAGISFGVNRWTLSHDAYESRSGGIALGAEYFYPMGSVIPTFGLTTGYSEREYASSSYSSTYSGRTIQRSVEVALSMLALVDGGMAIGPRVSGVWTFFEGEQTNATSYGISVRYFVFPDRPGRTQDLPGHGLPGSRFHVSLLGGMSIAHVGGKDVKSDVQSIEGVSAGASLEYRASRYFSFRTGIAYKEKGVGVENSSVATRNRFTYLEIPFQLMIRGDIVEHDFYIAMGPGYGFLLSATRTDTRGGAGLDIDLKDQMPSTEVTMDVALGVALTDGPLPLLIEARYSWGMSTIDKSARHEGYNRCIELLLATRFEL